MLATSPEGKLTAVVVKSPEYIEEISDGLIILHNPFAKNPVPVDFFRKNRVVQVYSDNSSYLYFEHYDDRLQTRSVHTIGFK